MACRRLGKGAPKLNSVTSLASRFISFIDGALGYNTKAKAKAPKTPYYDPNLSTFFDTADDVKAPTQSIEEPVDIDSWSTHVEKHAEDYKGINAGWGVGHRNRDSWFSYEDGDESHFSVGPNPFRKKPIDYNKFGVDANGVPITKPDDRASLPSRRSSPSSTSSLVPRPLSIHRSGAVARGRSSWVPAPPREIPTPLRAGPPRVSDEAIAVAFSNGGHYGASNRRHGICILPEMEDTDEEPIELDIPSYHGSDASSEVEVAGAEINLNIPDYISSSDPESEVAELEAESTTTTPIELEATSKLSTNPEYDGSLYGDVVTSLPDNWDWADSDTSSIPSRSPTPVPNRDELLFQHPSLRQNWSSGPRSAAPARPHFAAAAAPARVPGEPATHFDHFNFPVGGNEVPTFEGSLMGSISRYWA
jgi:hypothetical protein